MMQIRKTLDFLQPILTRRVNQLKYSLYMMIFNKMLAFKKVFKFHSVRCLDARYLKNDTIFFTCFVISIFFISMKISDI